MNKLNNYKFVLVLLIVNLISSFVANEVLAQKVITQCGASSGKSLFLNPNEGWQEDGISDGSIIFIKDSEGKYDVIMKFAETTKSAIEDGGLILPLKDEGGYITLSVVYPTRTVETYQLTLDNYGRGRLIWSNMKNSVPPLNVVKGSLFQAKCSK